MLAREDGTRVSAKGLPDRRRWPTAKRIDDAPFAMPQLGLGGRKAMCDSGSATLERS